MKRRDKEKTDKEMIDHLKFNDNYDIAYRFSQLKKQVSKLKKQVTDLKDFYKQAEKEINGCLNCEYAAGGQVLCESACERDSTYNHIDYSCKKWEEIK